jgi:hypothetical protein
MTDVLIKRGNSKADIDTWRVLYNVKTIIHKPKIRASNKYFPHALNQKEPILQIP